MTAEKHLLNDEEAAAYIGVRPQTLRDWRHHQRYGLPYVRVGRLIRYRLTDLQTWIESRLVGAAEQEA